MIFKKKFWQMAQLKLLSMFMKISSVINQVFINMLLEIISEDMPLEFWDGVLMDLLHTGLLQTLGIPIGETKEYSGF